MSMGIKGSEDIAELFSIFHDAYLISTLDVKQNSKNVRRSK